MKIPRQLREISSLVNYYFDSILLYSSARITQEKHISFLRIFSSRI